MQLILNSELLGVNCGNFYYFIKNNNVNYFNAHYVDEFVKLVAEKIFFWSALMDCRFSNR